MVSPTSASTAEYLAADLKVREMLRKKLAQAGISQIQIERPANTARVTIHTARPGIVIGKKRRGHREAAQDVSKLMGVPVHINVAEVRKPELDAQLVAESIAQQLERRIMFRRAMKRAVGNAMRLGAWASRSTSRGRLNGAEIARSEWYREGRVPLHTLRADIDYGFSEAHDHLRDHRREGLDLQGRSLRFLPGRPGKAPKSATSARPVRQREHEVSRHVATKANQVPQGR